MNLALSMRLILMMSLEISRYRPFEGVFDASWKPEG